MLPVGNSENAKNTPVEKSARIKIVEEFHVFTTSVSYLKIFPKDFIGRFEAGKSKLSVNVRPNLSIRVTNCANFLRPAVPENYPNVKHYSLNFSHLFDSHTSIEKGIVSSGVCESNMWLKVRL